MDIFNVLDLICGLSLFLYGMHVMGEGLSRASGGKLESILERLTDTRLKAVLLGAAVTAVIQSSSATTVMVVGFVNSGIMQLSQTVGIIMGANVGTTITSWLLSLTGIESSNFIVQMFKPSSFTPILALMGVAFLMFTKNEKKHNIGTVLVGFTVLMCGMSMMSDSVKPLADVPAFTNILLMFENPFLGMIAGAVLTAVIQSSSASVGILQALCITGAVSYGAALPIIMGQNIGTCVTAMISSIGASKNAKRAALIHLYFNLISTLVLMVIFYAINAVFPFAFLHGTANAAGIAVVHTAFNIVATAGWMPFANVLERLAVLTIRDDEKVERIDDFQLLDERFLAKPGFAVEQCRVVSARMAELTREAIFEALDLIDGGEYTAEKAERIEALETKIDHYEDNLGTYMVKLSHEKLSTVDGHTVSMLLRTINDFERISDHAVNLLDSAKEMDEKKLTFSEGAKAELHVFAEAVRDVVSRAMDSFLEQDEKKAHSVEPLESCIDDLNVNIRRRHTDRLTTGACTIQNGFVLTDISTNLERVADHCSNIAISLIQMPKDEFDAHEYLENIKRVDRDEFEREEQRFAQLYRLPN